MLGRFFSHLSYANVMATFAVFIALGGGAYALSIPKNSVGARQIKSNAVRASEIKRNAVRSSEVKNASLLKSDFKAGQLPEGPRGLQGPPGATGAPGSPAASAVLGNTATDLSIVANQRVAPSGPSTPISVTMPGNEQRSPNATMVARDLSVGLTAAPGGAAARTFTLVDDGTATPVSCTISGADTACDSGGATATISPGSTLAINASLTVTPPGAARASWGWRATTP